MRTGRSRQADARASSIAKQSDSGVLVCDAFREPTSTLKWAAARLPCDQGLPRKRRSYVPISSMSATPVNSTPVVSSHANANFFTNPYGSGR